MAWGQSTVLHRVDAPSRGALIEGRGDDEISQPRADSVGETVVKSLVFDAQFFAAAAMATSHAYSSSEALGESVSRSFLTLRCAHLALHFAIHDAGHHQQPPKPRLSEALATVARQHRAIASIVYRLQAQGFAGFANWFDDGGDEELESTQVDNFTTDFCVSGKSAGDCEGNPKFFAGCRFTCNGCRRCGYARNGPMTKRTETHRLEHEIRAAITLVRAPGGPLKPAEPPRVIASPPEMGMVHRELQDMLSSEMRVPGTLHLRTPVRALPPPPRYVSVGSAFDSSVALATATANVSTHPPPQQPQPQQVTLPGIMFGTGSIGIDEDLQRRYSDAEAVDILYTALREGYRGFDTAQLYNNTVLIGFAIERALTAGVLRSAAEVLITTKVGPFSDSDISGFTNGHEERIDAYSTVKRQQRELRGATIVLVMHHHGNTDSPRAQSIVRKQLERLVREGIVQGLTSDELDGLRPRGARPIGQYSVNLLSSHLDLLAARAIGHVDTVMAYGLQTPEDTPMLPVMSPFLALVARRVGLPSSRALLNWAALQRGGMIVLVGSTNQSHMAENLHAPYFEMPTPPPLPLSSWPSSLPARAANATTNAHAAGVRRRRRSVARPDSASLEAVLSLAALTRWFPTCRGDPLRADVFGLSPAADTAGHSSDDARVEDTSLWPTDVDDRFWWADTSEQNSAYYEAEMGPLWPSYGGWACAFATGTAASWEK